MVAFLKQLWLAKHTHVDLRCDLIWIVRVVLPVPALDRLNVSAEVLEELSSRRGNVSIVRAQIVSLPQKHEVVELQERFQPFVAEEIDVVLHDCIQKLICRKHILSHGVGKVVAAAIEYCVDCRKVTLRIVQLILDAPEVQSQPFHHPSSFPSQSA